MFYPQTCIRLVFPFSRLKLGFILYLSALKNNETNTPCWTLQPYSDSDSSKWKGALALSESMHISMDKSMVNKDSIIATSNDIRLTRSNLRY